MAAPAASGADGSGQQLMKRLVIKPVFPMPRVMCSVCRDALEVMERCDFAVVIEVPYDWMNDDPVHSYEICAIEWNPLWRDWQLRVHWLCGWSAAKNLFMELSVVNAAVAQTDRREFKNALLMLALAGEM